MENFRQSSSPNGNNLIQTPNRTTKINNNDDDDQRKQPVKVKYISNPMMVKAKNESEFRAIVQKLTGQHSADHAFHQSPSQEFNQVFYPPPSPSTAAASFDPKDCTYGSVSGDVVYSTVGVRNDWRGEMEGGSFSGYQPSSYVDIW